MCVCVCVIVCNVWVFVCILDFVLCWSVCMGVFVMCGRVLYINIYIYIINNMLHYMVSIYDPVFLY